MNKKLCLLLIMFAFNYLAAPSAMAHGDSGHGHAKVVETPWLSWGLNESDWKDYQQIMEGPRGLWSPDLDPITTLGIEAKSETKQQHYALLYTKQFDERVRKETRFQATLNAVRAQYYSSDKQSTVQGNPKAHIYALYIPAGECVDACIDRLNRALSLVNADDVQLHIYLAGAANIQIIRDWIRAHSIPPHQIANHQVQVHNDNGNYKGIKKKHPNIPYPALLAISKTGIKVVRH